MDNKLDNYIKGKINELDKKPVKGQNIQVEEIWNKIDKNTGWFSFLSSPKAAWIISNVIAMSVIVGVVVHLNKKIDSLQNIVNSGTTINKEHTINQTNTIKTNSTQNNDNIRSEKVETVQSKPLTNKVLSKIIQDKNETENPHYKDSKLELNSYSNNVFKMGVFIPLGNERITTYADSMYSDSFNHVINSSFETAINNDFSYSSTTWKKCLKSDSPDYFSNLEESAADFTQYQGGTAPNSGNAFVGMFCYRKRIDMPNAKSNREFIQSRLIQPLKKDSIYTVSMWVHLDSESTGKLKQLNVLFRSSKLELKKENELLRYRPQLSLNIPDAQTKTWVLIKEQYKAKGNERYMVIGNLAKDDANAIININKKDDSRIPKWNADAREQIAYYYFDDIKIHQQKTTITKKEMLVSSEYPSSISIPNYTGDSTIFLREIMFNQGETNLLETSFYSLNSLVEFANSNDNSIFELVIYTDKEILNQQEDLLLKRQDAILKYLFENGISENRIKLQAGVAKFQ